MAKKGKKSTTSKKNTSAKKQAQAAAEEAAGLFEGLAGASDGLYEVGARIGNHRVLLNVQSAADRAYQLVISDLSGDEVLSTLEAVGISLSESEAEEPEEEEEEDDEEEAEEEDDEDEEEDEEEDDEDEEEDDEDEEDEEEEEEEDEEGIEISESTMKKIGKAQTPMKVASLVVKDTEIDDVDTLVEILEALRSSGVKALKGKKKAGLKKAAAAAIE